MNKPPDPVLVYRSLPSPRDSLTDLCDFPKGLLSLALLPCPGRSPDLPWLPAMPLPAPLVRAAWVLGNLHEFVGLATLCTVLEVYCAILLSGKVRYGRLYFRSISQAPPCQVWLVPFHPLSWPSGVYLLLWNFDCPGLWIICAYGASWIISEYGRILLFSGQFKHCFWLHCTELGGIFSLVSHG